jgi:ABC-2 type transport system ATP-binding protein
VFAELLAAVRGEDRAVFISSHAITDLERFADHVGMIKAGKLLFEGPVVDIVERYRMVERRLPIFASPRARTGRYYITV